MFVEISLDSLCRLYGSAALGKLMGGLVHNLNGPLQNLGMDLEMMIYSLADTDPSRDSPSKGFGARLKRMETELDAINHLIRTTAGKANWENEYQGSIGLSHFLQQELSFLEANLYFKHNVLKKIEMEEDLSSGDRLPEGVVLPLCWLMQALVEELERREIKALSVKTRAAQGAVKIIFTIEEGNLSPPFVAGLNLPVPSSGTLKIDGDDAGMMLAVAVLKSAGVLVTCRIGPPGTDIILTLPATNPSGDPG